MIQAALKKIFVDTLKQLPQGANLTEAHFARFAIELPKDKSHGDYATNVAMTLTKVLKMPPRAIAEAIKCNLVDKDGLIDSLEIAGPGFINLKMAQKTWNLALSSVLETDASFGKLPPNGQKVLLEYISANPTGPLHLGHARGAFVGDAIGRLLKAAGYEVCEEFYVNDAGNQINILGKSIYARYRELFGEKISLESGEYPGAYIIDIAQKLKDSDGDIWLSKTENEWLPRCIEIGIEENLAGIQRDLKLADIAFDNFYLESTLHERGLTQKIVQDYDEKGMLYDAKVARGTEDKVRRDDSNAAQYKAQQRGGKFLKTEQFGDTEDRILVRANGEPVYLTADLAYHQEKYDRGFDKLIDVFGADHAGHTPRIKAGMMGLGLDEKKLEFVLVQMVRLLKAGKEVRFSKRSGEIHLLSELIKDLGSDVVRYIFLSRSPDTQFDINLDLFSKSGSENPVFYLQYGHARMATLLKRAASEGKAFVGLGSMPAGALGRLDLPEENALIQKMDTLPGLVLSAANTLEPHKIIYFAQELIKDFHGYFTKYRTTERIISDDSELTQSRLALVSALKICIANALSLLGISAPDHMELGSE